MGLKLKMTTAVATVSGTQVDRHINSAQTHQLPFLLWPGLPARPLLLLPRWAGVELETSNNTMLLPGAQSARNTSSSSPLAAVSKSNRRRTRRIRDRTILPITATAPRRDRRNRSSLPASTGALQSHKRPRKRQTATTMSPPRRSSWRKRRMIPMLLSLIQTGRRRTTAMLPSTIASTAIGTTFLAVADGSLIFPIRATLNNMRPSTTTLLPIRSGASHPRDGAKLPVLTRRRSAR